jgi:hypothetical protein
VTFFDENLFRINWFSGSKGYLRSEPVSRALLGALLGGSVRRERLTFLEDWSLVVATIVNRAMYPEVPGTLRPSYRVLHIDPDFGAARDLGIRYGAPERFAVEQDRALIAVDPPAAYGSHHAAGGDPRRVCFGDDATTIVECFDLERGRVSLRWEQPPIPLTQIDIAAWRARQLADTAQRRRLGPRIERLLDEIELKSTRPTMRSILIDSEGNVLVESADQAAANPAWRRFRLFEPGGKLVGFVDLPGIRVTEIGPDYVLGVGRLRYDVEQVVIYDLAR